MTTSSVTRLGSGVDEVRLSANGRYVAFWSGGRTARYDRTTGRTVTVNEGSHPEISGSGRHVVTWHLDENDQPVYLFTDLSAGTTRDLLAAAKASPDWSWVDYPGYPVLSTNGRYAAFNTDASGLVPSDDGVTDGFYVVDTGGQDEVYGFENVDGSAYDDRIFANHRDNLVRGMGGDDEMVGHAGNDAMVGGGGTDSCDGEAGTGTAATCEDVDDVP